MAATEAYREQMLRVRANTYADLLQIWPLFDPDNPRAVAAWLTAAGAVTRRDRNRFVLLTQQYLTQHAAESGRTVRPAAAEPLDRQQLATSLRVTSLVAYATARRAGKQPAQALDIAAVRSSGAATRLALNGGRSVVQQTARAGDLAGWIRVGAPQCDLCKTILGRFYPPTTRDFTCHDHCACSFEPAYR